MEEADLEMDYLMQKDFKRKSGYTDEYDFDDEKIKKIKQEKKIDILVENMKGLVDMDEESIRKMFEKDPSLIKKFSGIISGNFDPSDPEQSAEEAIAKREKEEL